MLSKSAGLCRHLREKVSRCEIASLAALPVNALCALRRNGLSLLIISIAHRCTPFVEMASRRFCPNQHSAEAANPPMVDFAMAEVSLSLRGSLSYARSARCFPAQLHHSSISRTPGCLRTQSRVAFRHICPCGKMVVVRQPSACRSALRRGRAAILRKVAKGRNSHSRCSSPHGRDCSAKPPDERNVISLVHADIIGGVREIDEHPCSNAAFRRM